MDEEYKKEGCGGVAEDGEDKEMETWGEWQMDHGKENFKRAENKRKETRKSDD